MDAIDYLAYERFEQPVSEPVLWRMVRAAILIGLAAAFISSGVIATRYLLDPPRLVDPFLFSPGNA